MQHSENIEKITTQQSNNQQIGSLPPNFIKDMALEEIIHIFNKIGIEYVEKRKESEKLDLMRTSIRSQIMNRIEKKIGKFSETKLKRMAEGDDEYIEFLEKIVTSRAESEKLRIRYESYKSLFDARRTLISFKKVELKSL